jgi:allantoate deiminase
MREANALVAGWMEEAGLEVSTDAVGNLIGRRGGDGPALLLGSHLDTVVDAGRYDGPLGVLVALEAVALAPGDEPLAVIAFADEEGTRFGTSFLGSSALAGRLDPDVLERTDGDGVRLADALRAFGGDPEALGSAALRPETLRGYVEVHIEQGPVLEERDLPVGVVSAIAGQTHGEVALHGLAGHAGTVPMGQRRDALAAAAELVLAAEAVARERGVLATVGRLEVAPGARNVIPARVVLSLDLRAPEDAARSAAAAELEAGARAIAARRGLVLGWTAREASPAVALHTDALAAAVTAAGLPVALLPSGAGHDAVMLAALTPAEMLFVRCRGGISHHPDESVRREDVAAAIAVLDRRLSDPRGAAAPPP